MNEAQNDTGAASPASQAVGIVRLGFSFAGTMLVGVGGYLQYPPLGFAAAGCMLYGIAVLGELRSRR